ncbi:MAG: hypothetical protein ACFE8P_04975, partial [Promethearchaeota archaeon]
MSPFTFINIRKSKRKEHSSFKKIAGLFLALIFIGSIIIANNPHSIDNNQVQEKNFYNIEPVDLNTAAIPEEWLICPYTKNKSDIYAFLNSNFNTSYSDLLYFRKGNEDGTAFYDESVYSIDNLLYYKTLAQQKQAYSGNYISSMYNDLTQTNLMSSQGYGGFVGSINGTSGGVIDGNRYLLDNLIPIFVLMENYVSGSLGFINDVSSLLENEFWDGDDYGYYHSNSSSSANKDAIDNLYAVMANLLIYKTLGDTTSYLRANQTMYKLMSHMWNETYLGFDIEKDEHWGNTGANLKRLDVNAIGIMTLVDYWMVTNISSYLHNASLLYNRLNARLWSSEGAYHITSSDPLWTTPSSDEDRIISSEANALMMQACLKLFEATGNMTYYDKAYELFKTFENKFYDSTNNAYGYINYPGVYQSNNKNMTSNLRVLEAYLDAAEIYHSFEVIASFEGGQALPNFIFNQDKMNITTRLSYQAFQNVSYYSNIEINYSIRTSNEVGYGWTIINQTSGITGGTYKTHNFSYDITDAMPVKTNYSVLIWTYSEKYQYDEIVLYFNVVSGLEVETIINLEEVLYQGPTRNVTLPVNNTRNENVTLDVAMEGANIVNKTILGVFFQSNNMTYVSFNLTTKQNAVLGEDEIIFRFTDGSIEFLEIHAPITIGDSFKYTPLIYRDELVSGDLMDINFNLVNYLPSDSQTINVSFLGSAIETMIQ